MTTLELIDEKEQLKLKANNIISGAEQESRKLTDEELSKYNELVESIKDKDNEIRKINETLNKRTLQTNKNDMENFSLLKAINAVANGKQVDERAQEVITEGVAEMRKTGLSFNGQIQLPVVESRADVVAGVATNGAEAVAVDKLNILEPLRANLVMAQAGANIMTGLVGNVSIPLYDGTTVGWEGEVDPAKDGAGNFSEVELTPKRLTAIVDVSKQFLLQDSVGAEMMLRNDIVKAISSELEATILGAEVGNAKKPAGVFNGADAATLTYEGTVAMEQELEEANVNGEYTYILSPKAKAALRTAKKGENGFVMEAGEVNGIKTLCTSAAKGVVLGNFSEYVIAQWGAIDLVVDPYTQAANGKVRLVVNAYFDAKPRRSEAFVAGVVE